MKVGDLVVFSECVTGIVTGLDRDPYGFVNPVEVKVLLADSDCEEWVETEALRIINENR